MADDKDEKKDAKDKEPAPNKTREWVLAILVMLVLCGMLAAMIALMLNARNSALGM